jgi:mannitol-specific phosphotransferase system IIBC component
MTFDILPLIVFIEYYMLGIVTFWIIQALIAGYNGIEIGKQEFYASVLWPISTATLIGLIIRVVIEKLKESNKERKIRKEKKIQQAKEQEKKEKSAELARVKKLKEQKDQKDQKEKSDVLMAFAEAAKNKGK